MFIRSTKINFDFTYRECEGKFRIIVKYLVSVNRMYGLKDATENIELAIALQKKYPKYVVGLDLSGDPREGATFLNLLKKSRDAGLKITAHCGEVSITNSILNQIFII